MDFLVIVNVSKVTGYDSLQQASLLQELTCQMGSHSVTCHPVEVIFSFLQELVQADTRFSNTTWIQGRVDLVGLVTKILSPTPVLTKPSVEQLCSCDEWCYQNAEPPYILSSVCQFLETL